MIDRMEKTPQPVPQKTSFLLASLTIVATIVLFFLLLEGALALFGVQPVVHKEDPFVGFAGNAPLFIPGSGADGQPTMVTAPGKYTYFNPQQFPRAKPRNTYRIFTLGGSTTFGRPYNDLTSFSGWLRELLPVADESRKWEVINAGGISYASYRVANLMEELAQYQPDLFIVYTGHNEFLEERTYGALRDVPEIVKSTAAVLAKTRTWAAMNAALKPLGLVKEEAQPQKVQLATEVTAILDKSSGLNNYRRDDALRERILEHYRVSLERMAEIARAAGAQIIFVTPESNLKDFSPFKSEHSAGLDPGRVKYVENLLATANTAMQKSDWSGALAPLDDALALDPRYAELHFQRGRVLLALGRNEESYAAFERARDEDVCPLRALTPMRKIVTAVAREEKVPLVDYAALVEEEAQTTTGQRSPGAESFFDHVHPTIAGHQLLANALVKSMIENRIVTPGAAWPVVANTEAERRIEARIDPHLQAKSLLNLAKVLSWARKVDDSRRSARQAVAAARNYPDILTQASFILINLSDEEKEPARAERYIHEALAADPWNAINHKQLGMRLLRENRGREGAAHFLLAAALVPESASFNSLLGQVLFENHYYQEAYPYLLRAGQLDPRDSVNQQALSALSKRLGAAAAALPMAPIVIRRDAAKLPREVFLTTAQGVLDGFYTEWYADGNLKRFAEYRQGVVEGVDLRWSAGGERMMK